MRVLIAIEPRFYREAVGETVRGLRPHVEVSVLDPDALEAEAGRRPGPALVFASLPRPQAPLAGDASWVQFLPYEHPPARVCLGGRRWELGEVGMEDLLSIVDEAEELWPGREGSSSGTARGAS